MDSKQGQTLPGGILTLEYECERLRSFIKEIGVDVLTLNGYEYLKREDDFPGQHDEIIANIMLAYRHLEDARMRLGKAMQQIQGGVSIFDKVTFRAVPSKQNEQNEQGEIK